MAAIDEVREAILAQNPTKQQRKAIFAEELEFLLRAAPGGGKTWTSCRRFIWRAANWPHGVGGLALLSFTNAAIHEFRTATIDIGRRDLLSDPNYVGTFDSFVERYILGPFGHLLTGGDRRPNLFPGPRPGDRKNTRLQVWRNRKGGRNFPVQAWDVIPYLDGEKLRFNASAGSSSILPFTVANDAVQELLALGFYAHPQRVFWACKLLFKRPRIAEVLARRFPEIIVDEAQDSNAWLLVLLNFLRDKGARVTLVGDPDQCLYEFSGADATSLDNLKRKWSIPERPLSQSFRCNNQIAAAVRNVGGNICFTGAGDGGSEWRRALVVEESSETQSDSLAAFQRLAGQAGLSIDSAVVVCRGHSQLESLRGTRNYTKLQGKAKELAEVACLRDSLRDYRRASQTVERIVRELTGDDPLWERIDEDPMSHERIALALAIWKFVKSPDRLAPVSLRGDRWILSVREQMARLIDDIGLECDARLGNHIKTTGLSAAEKALPLFESVPEFPEVRQETIHRVKGESIDAVLVIGSTKFWNSMMTAVRKDENTEARRLAYVAMTRARHLLVVGLPASHYEKHLETWVEWGFRVAT